jgi:biotin carboxyl carrier protein
MRYFVTLPSREELAVDIVHLPTGGMQVEVDGERLDVDTHHADGAWSVRIGHRMVDLRLDGQPPKLRFAAAGVRLQARVESERSRASAGTEADTGGAGDVAAPMPGRVVKVLVSEGDEVTPGMPVIVVEAMKMENELCAGAAGTVAEICAEPGHNVDGGAVLVRIN